MSNRKPRQRENVNTGGQAQQGFVVPEEDKDLTLSWNERQELSIRRDDEEARKSEYYCDSFEQMGLNENILRGVYAYGFNDPSRIQKRGVKAILSKRDCIVQSQSGTGKTGTFTLGILGNVDAERKELQVIVISPIRELAEQSQRVITQIGQHTGVKSSLCIGSMRLDENIKQSQVLVCTPGRLIDCIGKGIIDSSKVSMIVFDEADEMLADGFKEQVFDIFQNIPESCQVVLVSATLSPEVLSITDQFMKDPIQILIKQEEVTLRGISQFYINCIRNEYKLETLIDIYKRFMVNQSIIYVNSKNKCCWLASELIRRNYTVLYVDSSMPQRERSRIVREFRNGTCRVLITTNLLSRGIDIQGVNLVVNYDLPGSNNVESYVHRIGRCGRYGRKGVAINFITPNEYYLIQNIRRYYSTQIEEMPEDISKFM